MQALSREDAAQAVTDGTGDNGLDAVLVDLAEARLILVQSKWHGSGTGTIGVAETHVFRQGFKDLTDEAYDRFNAKIQAKQADISAALRLTDLVVEMIVVSTGGDILSPEAKALVDDLLSEMNTEGEEMVTVAVWGLEYLRARLASETGGARIDLAGVAIENWGSLTEPYLAYYGIVDGSVLKAWYDLHGEALFSQNIRKALGQTAVNASLHDTVSDSPEKFWYFNNGVTVLCERISKSALGASSRNFGEFDLVGASVVNGAQTVASVAGALASSSGEVAPKIWIRAISLEGCPEGFAADVTRATNTQNSVESRDFVSLDEEQVRLRTDFRLSLSKVYSIKRGEAEPGSTAPVLERPRVV